MLVMLVNLQCQLTMTDVNWQCRLTVSIRLYQFNCTLRFCKRKWLQTEMCKLNTRHITTNIDVWSKDTGHIELFCCNLMSVCCAGFLHGEIAALKCISCKKGYHARSYTYKGTGCDGVILQNRVNSIFLCKILIIVCYLKLSIIYQIRVQQLPKKQCTPCFSHCKWNCGTFSLIILWMIDTKQNVYKNMIFDWF